MEVIIVVVVLFYLAKGIFMVIDDGNRQRQKAHADMMKRLRRG